MHCTDPIIGEKYTYKEALRALNSLPNNAPIIAKRIVPSEDNTLQDTKKYLIRPFLQITMRKTDDNRSGLSLEQLDNLSVIHVTGTKGKGSTCAFVEAILREHGFRTGFYSSPHLVSVRERIRINGRPLNELEFARQFWQVYSALEQRKEYENDMPYVFKFFTILMFHVFVKANVDVTILEVGIGGECDCTNIVNSSVCTGIASLGLDHLTILGDTLEVITWHKSGIFKAGAPAFTVPQPNDAMSVLQARAEEKGCSLSVVPKLEEYPWRRGVVPILGIRSSVQSNNASLAIQLASAWMARHGRSRRSSALECTEDQRTTEEEPAIQKSKLCFDKVAAGLHSCKLPGRTQILLGRGLDFYIDGAHTYESIQCCVSWFRGLVQNDWRPRYLIFNTTGDRDSAKLIAPLKSLGFVKAYFAPNVAEGCELSDLKDVYTPVAEQLARCRKHAEIWGEDSVLANSVDEALRFIRQNHESSSTNDSNCKPQVLVTGSLLLVGVLLSVVDPELTMSSKI